MTIGMNNLGRNGRLGNQMFQYAALVGIAKQCGYDFRIPDYKRVDIGFSLILKKENRQWSIAMWLDQRDLHWPKFSHHNLDLDQNYYLCDDNT